MTANPQPNGSAGPLLTAEEALDAINELRSNVVATQNASWSNLMYPLVAILNAAGRTQLADRTPHQREQHQRCYGGAGGYPGNELADEHQCVVCGERDRGRGDWGLDHARRCGGHVKRPAGWNA